MGGIYRPIPLKTFTSFWRVMGGNSMQEWGVKAVFFFGGGGGGKCYKSIGVTIPLGSPNLTLFNLGSKSFLDKGKLNCWPVWADKNFC